MRLSICHLRNELYNYDINYSNVEFLYHKSVNENVELVVFPESAFSGYAVIDTKHITDKFFEAEFSCLLKLFHLVKQFKTPVTIGCHFYDKTYNSSEAYFLITCNKIQLLKTKIRHNCIKDRYSSVDHDGVIFELNSKKFSTLICSESMCVNMLNSAVKESNIILNPSAYGECMNPVNYDLLCDANAFDNTLIIIPNLSLINDQFQYGRSMIKIGNTMLFEKHCLQNMAIIFDTETNTVYERY